MNLADENDECGGARWAAEVIAVLREDCWAIMRSAGSADYQGSGVVLAQRGGEWSVFGWSYGSCNVCDRWEDQEETLAYDVRSELQVFGNEADAVARYEEMISAIW